MNKLSNLIGVKLGAKLFIFYGCFSTLMIFLGFVYDDGGIVFHNPKISLIGWLVVTFPFIPLGFLFAHGSWLSYREKCLLGSTIPDKIRSAVMYAFYGIFFGSTFCIIPFALIEGFGPKIKQYNYISSERYSDSIKVSDSVKTYTNAVKKNILTNFAEFFNKEFSDSYYCKPVYSERHDSIEYGYKFSIGGHAVSELYNTTNLQNFVSNRQDFCVVSAKNESSFYAEYSACIENLDIIVFRKDTVFIDTTSISSPMIINGTDRKSVV